MSKFSIYADENGDIKGIGKHCFDQVPRIGEFISIPIDGSEKFFKVMSVLHITSDQGKNTTNSGEILVKPVREYSEGLKWFKV